MVSSIARSTASGSTAVFSVPFPYLDKTHVQVRLDGVLKTLGVDYSFPTSSTIQITAGNPAAGTVVERKRVTPTDPLTDFSPGNLDTGDLNVGILQPLYLAQEAGDHAADLEERGFYSVNFADGGFVPLPEANKVLGWNTAGTALENKSVIDLGAAVVLDEDNMASNRDDAVPTQQSVKAYADSGLSIHNATSKATPVDADEVPLADSAATFGRKKSTWAQIKAFLFNTPTLVTPWIDYATGRSINLQKTINGAFSTSARYEANGLGIVNDSVDMGLDGGKVDGLTINQTFGGSTARGGRHAIDTFCTLQTATASDNPDRNYVGGAFTGWALVSDGGTDTGAGSKGGMFGINPQAVLASGATNFANVTGGEVNVAINTGASSKYKSGLSICNRSDDAVKGSLYDALLSLSNQTATVQFDYGIMFSNANGAHPVDGSLIGTNGAASCVNGIDFTSYTFSGSLIKGVGFSVGGTGNIGMPGSNASIEMGNPNIANAPFIDLHSSGNVNDYDVRLQATGGAASAGQGTLAVTGGLSVSGFVQASQVKASGTGGVGYSTGAGGTVTQATSKATGVTLNKTCGTITMNNAALAADTTVAFVLTNSTIAAGDLIILNQLAGGVLNGYVLNGACAAGSATIYLRNVSAGSLSDTPVIAFAVIKAVTS